MNKYLESPQPCIHCERPTVFGSGRFVNRLPADTYHGLPNGKAEYRDGYACAECMGLDCDRCPDSIELDEDIGVEQVYGENTLRHLFDDGAWRVHEKCLTPGEQILFKKEES